MIDVHCTTPVPGWNLVGEDLGVPYGSVEATLVGPYTGAAWAWRIIDADNFNAIITDANELKFIVGGYVDGEWALLDEVEGVAINDRWRVTQDESGLVTVEAVVDGETEVLIEVDYEGANEDGTHFGVGLDQGIAGSAYWHHLVINGNDQPIYANPLPPEGGPIVGPPLRSSIAP